MTRANASVPVMQPRPVLKSGGALTCGAAQELRIDTSTIPTRHHLATLMHDPQDRVAVAWQNTAYNQPPHPSVYLDEAAPLPPRPNITTAAAMN